MDEPVEPRGVQQESGATAESGRGASVLRVRAGAGQTASVGRTLHRGWHVDRSLGQPEKFSEKDGGDGDGSQFRGDKRTNDTHESKTDPDAKLYRKGNGQEAKLGYGVREVIYPDPGLLAGDQFDGFRFSMLSRRRAGAGFRQNIPQKL